MRRASCACCAVTTGAPPPHHRAGPPSDRNSTDQSERRPMTVTQDPTTAAADDAPDLRPVATRSRNTRRPLGSMALAPVVLVAGALAACTPAPGGTASVTYE